MLQYLRMVLCKYNVSRQGWELSDKVFYRVSAWWKGVQYCNTWMRQKFRLGSGRDVKFWQEIWIGDVCCLISVLVSCRLQWKVLESMSALVRMRVKVCAITFRRILISLLGPVPNLGLAAEARVWGPCTTGKFSFETLREFITRRPLQFWKLKYPIKVSVFIWCVACGVWRVACGVVHDSHRR